MAEAGGMWDEGDAPVRASVNFIVGEQLRAPPCSPLGKDCASRRCDVGAVATVLQVVPSHAGRGGPVFVPLLHRQVSMLMVTVAVRYSPEDPASLVESCLKALE